MARIDRGRFDAARFPFAVEVPTRWSDLDLQGHVNNAAAVAILQEGRVAFNRASGLPSSLGDRRTVVVGLTVDYAAELLHPDRLTVHAGVLAIGRTSFTIGQVVRQQRRSAVYAEAVMVLTGADGASPLPDTFRMTLETMRLVDAADA